MPGHAINMQIRAGVYTPDRVAERLPGQEAAYMAAQAAACTQDHATSHIEATYHHGLYSLIISRSTGWSIKPISPGLTCCRHGRSATRQAGGRGSTPRSFRLATRPAALCTANSRD